MFEPIRECRSLDFICSNRVDVETAAIFGYESFAWSIFDGFGSKPVEPDGQEDQSVEHSQQDDA